MYCEFEFTTARQRVFVVLISGSFPHETRGFRPKLGDFARMCTSENRFLRRVPRDNPVFLRTRVGRCALWQGAVSRSWRGDLSTLRGRARSHSMWKQRKSYSRYYAAFFRFPFIFPLAHRAFMAFEIRVRAAALMRRRRRVGNELLAEERRPRFPVEPSSAAMALLRRSRSARSSVRID